MDKLLSGGPGSNESRRMAGVACTKLSRAVANQERGLILGTCQVNTKTYGIFFHLTGTQDIYQLWNAIHHSWMPQSYSSLPR